MRKRVLSMLLACVMMITLFQSNVFADGSEVDSLVKNNKFMQSYISVEDASFRTTYLVGTLNNKYDYSSQIIYWKAYDSESSYGDYRGYLTINSADVVNDSATPNAFSVENKDSGFNIVANSVGTATLNLRYDVPDGYSDPNNGCFSIKIEAVEEYANVQVNKLGEDRYDHDIIPGNSVSLKAKIDTYYSEDGADSVKEMEHPILSYEWSLDSDYKGAATLTQDSSDPSKCTINTTKALTESITVDVVVAYTDLYGKNQKETATYTLQLKDEIYKLNCVMPEYILMNNSVVLKPIVSKSDSNGTFTINNNDIKYTVSTSDAANSVVDNGDGTYTITRKTENPFDVNIIAKYRDQELSESYSVDGCNDLISFSQECIDYGEVQTGSLCLKIPKQLPNGLSFDLFYTSDKNSSPVKIDKTNYSIKYTVKGVAYIFINDEWLDITFVNNNCSELNLHIEASVYEQKVCKSQIKIYLNDHSFSQPLNNILLLNQIKYISDRGLIYKENYDSEYISCPYIVDSINSNDSKIVSVTKEKGKWGYKGCGIGMAKLTINYHYFENSQIVNKKKTLPVTVKKDSKALQISKEGRRQPYLYPNNEYYYDLTHIVTEYGADGKIKKYKSDEIFNYEVSWSCGNGVMATSEMVSGNRLKVKIDSNSKFGQAAMQIVAKDDEGNEVDRSGLYNWVSNAATYVCYFDFLSKNYDEHNNEINNEYTIKPSLYLYDLDNPHGLDLSSKYNYNIVFDNNTDFIYKGKNNDGSFNVLHKSKNYNEQIRCDWVDENSEVISGDYVRLSPDLPPGNPNDSDSNKENHEVQIVEKTQSLSLMDDNSIGLNIHFKTQDGWCQMVRMSYVDQPDNNYYIAPDRNIVGPISYEYNLSVRVNSGEMAREIKLEFLDENGNVIDTVNTSVEKYAKSILESDDVSYDKYKPLVKAMLNYGAASQQYFGFMNNNLANRYLSVSDKAIGEIPDSIITRNNLIKKLYGVNGITYYGSSLVLKDQCVTRLYFKLDSDREISNYSFKLKTDKNVYKSIIPKEKGDLYYIELNNKTFFDSVSVRIFDEHGDLSGGCSISYSPLNYIARAYSSNSLDAKTKNLFNALYWFEYQKQQL